MRWLFLLPQLFEFGKALARCIEGGATKEEIEDALEQLKALVEAVPEFKGLLVVLYPLIKVAKMLLPEFLDSSSSVRLVRGQELRQEDVVAATAVLNIIGPVADKAMAQAEEEAREAMKVVDEMSDDEKMESVVKRIGEVS